MKTFLFETKTVIIETIKTYAMTILIFVFGCIPFFALGPTALTIFSLLALIMQMCVVYAFVNRRAVREIRDGQVGRLGLAKGFVTGAISVLPFILVMVLAELLLPASDDWMVLPDISGLVQVVMSYGGYFYYGASSSLWIRMTAFFYPIAISGFAYVTAIRGFDVDSWVDTYILKKPVQEDQESGYDYFKRTGRKF